MKGLADVTDARPQRFGLNYAQSSIIVEWLQPSTGKLFQRRIKVNSLRPDSDPGQLVESLRPACPGLLADPSLSLTGLVNLVKKLQTRQDDLKQQVSSAPSPMEQGSCDQPECLVVDVERRLPRRKRRSPNEIPIVARASKRSKEEDVRRAFEVIDVSGRGELELDELRSYLCDYLGFGQDEAFQLMVRPDAVGPSRTLSFESFRASYGNLNPYTILQRRDEVIFRKPGSLSGQQLNLDGLENCEVYICDTTASIFVDFCRDSLILIGPCESSVFVRDCEDCTFWLAAQQLRTHNCRRCTFFLYTKTEPIIEQSEDLTFAPWSAQYPKCSEHFRSLRFDPHRNLWNAIYDFTGKIGVTHWCIPALSEVVDLVVELDEPSTVLEAEVRPDNPCPEVTYDLLCSAPLVTGQTNCGHSVADIPQSQPAPPPRQHDTAAARRVRVAHDVCRGLATSSGQQAAASRQRAGGG